MNCEKIGRNLGNCLSKLRPLFWDGPYRNRYTVAWDEGFDQVIGDLAREDRIPKREVIRRALATYNYLKREELAGGHVALTSMDDQVVARVQLP